MTAARFTTLGTIRMMQRRRQLALAFGTVLITMLCSGCATSEKSRYERHLSALFQPDQATSTDVILAFGLNRGALPPNVVAVAGE